MLARLSVSVAPYLKAASVGILCVEAARQLLNGAAAETVSHTQIERLQVRTAQEVAKEALSLRSYKS